MARNRKGGGRPFGQSDQVRSKPNNEAKLAINTYEDVADSEDEFHINRDKILLDEAPAAKRIRLAEEDEALLEPSDEEVLPASEDEDDTDFNEDELDEEKEEQTTMASKRKQKPRPLGKPLQNSDSEAPGDGDEAGDEDDGAWGTTRKDYYHADVNETEQDALEEEAEARRLQQKQLQGMTEADFGFDEVDWLEGDKDKSEDAGAKGQVVREVIPRLEITDEMTTEERMKILRMRYPEFEPLATEFIDLQELHAELKERSQLYDDHYLNSNDRDHEVHPSKVTVVIKHRTLSAYLSALAMYFTLLTSTARSSGEKAAAMPPEKLQDHDVMGTLVQCRDLWTRVRHLPEPEVPASAVNGHMNGQTPIKAQIDTSTDADKDVSKSLKDVKRRKSKKSKAEKALMAQKLEMEARRLARLQETEASLAELSSLTAPSKLNSKIRMVPTEAHDSGSDIGDPTALTAAEMVDKARRKKTLRFYTSQIAQKSNKRSFAGRDAGGDDDLPYRERWKEKQARLQAEAEKGGKTRDLPGTDLGDGSDAEDGITNTARERKVAGSTNDNDYYEFVASQSRQKKMEKATRAAQVAGGAVQRINDDGEVGDDGKRAISYAIEKNKGLTPKRKKDVRNPRVKKRKKFEDKKKKLGSMKPVFKGGEGRGGYGGELTGIKKGLVRGVRL